MEAAKGRRQNKVITCTNSLAHSNCQHNARADTKFTAIAAREPKRWESKKYEDATRQDVTRLYMVHIGSYMAQMRTIP